MSNNAFDQLVDEVHESALRCGVVDSPIATRSLGIIDQNPKHVPLVTSAVLKIVENHDLDWCAENPDRVAQLAMSQISMFARVFFFVMSLFVPASALFTIISFLVPIILDMLSRRRAAGTLDLATLNSGAETFLTELRDQR